MSGTNWPRSGPFDIDTIRWTDGHVLGHDPEIRDDIEYQQRDENPELVYRDRPETVREVFDSVVAEYPERTALDFPDEDETFTYAEWDERSAAVAAMLQRQYDVEKGDHVAIVMQNIAAFPIALAATMKIGAVALIVNARLAERELEFILSHGNPSHVLLDGDILDTYAGVSIDLPGETFVTGESSDEYEAFDSLLAGDPTAVDEPRLDADDAVFLMYTSGTTGTPKGVVATNHNIIASIISFAIAIDVPDRDVPTTIIAVPLFHVTGLIAQLLHMLYVGGTSVVVKEFSTRKFVELIEEKQMNYFDGVPAIYSLMLGQENVEEYDLESWHAGMFGGAAMAPATIEELRETLPNLSIHNSYGATETTSGPATAMPDRHTDDHTESIGIPAPVCEMKIVDETGEVLPPGEVGELAVRGSFVAHSYYDNPEATAEGFEDGWFLSGDIATITEEGFVELKGREKRMITRGGENIYPLEVENVLAMHPDVLEAAITAIDDEVLGSRLLAVIVPAPNARLTEDDIIDFIQTRLADYKRPELYRFVDELPKTASGKVNQSELVPKALSYGIGSS